MVIDRHDTFASAFAVPFECLKFEEIKVGRPPCVRRLYSPYISLLMFLLERPNSRNMLKKVVSFKFSMKSNVKQNRNLGEVRRFRGIQKFYPINKIYTIRMPVTLVDRRFYLSRNMILERP